MELWRVGYSKFSKVLWTLGLSEFSEELQSLGPSKFSRRFRAVGLSKPTKQLWTAGNSKFACSVLALIYSSKARVAVTNSGWFYTETVVLRSES